MNIEADKIFFKLNLAINFVRKKYSEENIFGIFTYGDNKNIACVIIPTFEEICTKKDWISEYHNMDIVQEEIPIRLIDVRYVYQATKEGFPEIIESLYTEYYIINPRYEHIYHKLFRANREKFKEGIQCGKPAEELKIALINLMRAALNNNSKLVCFIKQLTDIEKTAIEHIIAAVGDEGIFSQAKVAVAAGISRAAMTNLIMKMKLSGVAQVEYFGNKGTYIKIIDDTLMRIRG